MPIYEYHCNGCNRDFEVEKRMSDPSEQVCPLCGSGETHRLISHTSFVLKGSGWYVTDYARKNGSSGSGGSHGSGHSPHPDRAGTPNGGNGEAPAASGSATGTQSPKPAPASKAPSPPSTSSGSAG